MKLNDSYIFLTNLRFHAYHGVMPQERSVGNDYRLDLRIKYNVANAMKSDNVNDTINYAEVYKMICQEMMVPSNLLERVAYRRPHCPPLPRGGGHRHQALQAQSSYGSRLRRSGSGTTLNK